MVESFSSLPKLTLLFFLDAPSVPDSLSSPSRSIARFPLVTNRLSVAPDAGCCANLPVIPCCPTGSSRLPGRILLMAVRKLLSASIFWFEATMLARAFDKSLLISALPVDLLFLLLFIVKSLLGLNPLRLCG